MSDTLDSVPGNWTLWVRMKDDQATATYQAVFAASGSVTVGSQTGSWEEKEGDTAENVTFKIQDPAGSGKELTFSGYMVGLAMGGYVKGPSLLDKILPDGSWAAYKTSD